MTVTTANRSAAPSIDLIALAALGGSLLSISIGASFAKGLFPAIGPEGATALRLSWPLF